MLREYSQLVDFFFSKYSFRCVALSCLDLDWLFYYNYDNFSKILQITVFRVNYLVRWAKRMRCAVYLCLSLLFHFAKVNWIKRKRKKKTNKYIIYVDHRQKCQQHQPYTICEMRKVEQLNNLSRFYCCRFQSSLGFFLSFLETGVRFSLVSIPNAKKRRTKKILLQFFFFHNERWQEEGE